MGSQRVGHDRVTELTDWLTGTVMATLGVSFHLLIEDQGLVLSAILVPFDSNLLYVVSLGYVILSKTGRPVSCPFLPLLQYHHVYPIISFILDAL